MYDTISKKEWMYIDLYQCKDPIFYGEKASINLHELLEV